MAATILVYIYKNLFEKTTSIAGMRRKVPRNFLQNKAHEMHSYAVGGGNVPRLALRSQHSVKSIVSMKARARSKRARLILNGKVAGNDVLRAAVARHRAAGHRLEVRVTWEDGDARRFVSEADEVDLLIAAGGDGTLNELLHGLMDLPEGTRPTLGIVPLGTANDFATGCGIPRDPAKALALCIKGEAVPIDVGKANDHWFINAASSGFGAEITATTAPELKRLLGPAAYTVMGAILAINAHQYRGMLRLPGREITGSGPVAIVGNGRQTGGGIQVAPRARIDDGLLDVLFVRQISPTALLAAARELQQLPPDGEYISYWQTPWVEVDPQEAIPVNLDGEPLRFSTVRYEAIPKAIQVIVPPNCPLLSNR
jgi:lipid kinase YegS